MTTWIALLRGINVGGNRKVPMADLREVVTDAGGEDVATYIQSGNVVFQHAVRSEAKVVAALEQGIEDRFGFSVAVVIRTAAQMAAVIDHNPYPVGEHTKLHVSFLAEPPTAAAVDKVDQEAFGRETFTVVGREVYLSLPDGMGRSKLAQTLSRGLLRDATSRNWRTVETLLDMADG